MYTDKWIHIPHTVFFHCQEIVKGKEKKKEKKKSIQLIYREKILEYLGSGPKTRRKRPVCLVPVES